MTARFAKWTGKPASRAKERELIALASKLPDENGRWGFAISGTTLVLVDKTMGAEHVWVAAVSKYRSRPLANEGLVVRARRRK
jgi:hypothetical protein